MPEMLQCLVIHPHEGLMPGDIVDMTEDQYEERTRNHPFPYFQILAGALLKTVAGTRLPAAPPEAELPRESAPAIPSVAAELALENLEDMTAMPGELHAEQYEPEMAPPFAAETVEQVIDESTPVTEPEPAVLEAPATAPVEEPDAPEPDAVAPEEVPLETVTVESVGDPPKARRSATTKK